MKAAHSLRKPVFAIKTTLDTDMHDVTTMYGFRYNGVKYYDVTGYGMESSMDELVRDMKVKHIV